METVDSGTSSIMLAPGDCVPTTVALFQIKYKILTMAADASPGLGTVRVQLLKMQVIQHFNIGQFDDEERKNSWFSWPVLVFVYAYKNI